MAVNRSFAGTQAAALLLLTVLMVTPPLLPCPRHCSFVTAAALSSGIRGHPHAAPEAPASRGAETKEQLEAAAPSAADTASPAADGDAATVAADHAVTAVLVGGLRGHPRADTGRMQVAAPSSASSASSAADTATPAAVGNADHVVTAAIISGLRGHPHADTDVVTAATASGIRGRSVPVSAASAFDSWAAEHGLSFTAEERARRVPIFARNLAFIEKHNGDHHPHHGTDALAGEDENDRTYLLGLNEYSHLTDEEFGELMGTHGKLHGSGIKGRQTRAVVSNTGSRKNLPAVRVAAVPPSLDWRAKGKVTPVRKQGKQCGELISLCGWEYHCGGFGLLFRANDAPLPCSLALCLRKTLHANV